VTARKKKKSGVLVTGICGRLGLELVRVLHRKERVIGIDRRKGSMLPSDVVHHHIDIRRRKARDIFRKAKVRAVVHMGVMHDPRQPSAERHSWNVDGFNSILQFIRAYKIPKLVLLSTGAVYGLNPANPQFISEDYTLMGGARDPELRDLIEVDMLAQSYFWRNPECETVILRPTQIVGKVRNGVMEYARMPRAPMAMGFDPMIQLVHEKDVIRAVMLALEPGVSGIFNIASRGQLPLSRVLSTLGKDPINLPSRVLRGALRLSQNLKAVGFTEAQLDYIMYPCMLDTSRAERKLGFKPLHDIHDCIEEARYCITEEP
jgi:UDP-glucose 4-epimerase